VTPCATSFDVSSVPYVIYSRQQTTLPTDVSNFLRIICVSLQMLNNIVKILIFIYILQYGRLPAANEKQSHDWSQSVRIRSADHLSSVDSTYLQSCNVILSDINVASYVAVEKSKFMLQF